MQHRLEMNAASEMQALMSKGSPTMLDRDSGFCSDEELDLHVGADAPSPPADASEDSGVDAKVAPAATVRNKRKCAEPLRIVNSADCLHHPIKKRPRFTSVHADEDEPADPFRPWSGENPAQLLNRHPGVTTLHRAFPVSGAQEEPLSLVAKSTSSTESPATSAVSEQSTQQQQQQQQQQRNYKNMTRERRIEANARERTRVHTISAAFDTLRRAIPAYSHNQKLSKLSVLRIACSYIMTLSRINGDADDGSESSLSECVDLVSRTIQTEGKLRKKKDE